MRIKPEVSWLGRQRITLLDAMHEYDTALKLLLQASTDSLIRQVTGGLKVVRWLNAEMPRVQTGRADLLGLTAEGVLLHFELQSTNDRDMALRMIEYALLIYRLFRRFPKQIVLYVGDAPLRMDDSWNEADLAFHYTLVDVRDLDSEALLASPHIEDNLLAILTRLRDQAGTVRQILRRIADLEEPERRSAFAQFLIISGLRRLAPVVKEEAAKMPILNDIMDHEVIGPAIRQGRQEGRSEILKRLLEMRFGSLPAWVEPRLSALSVSELDDLLVRVFDVTRVEELFSA